tara:strand:+ start:61 stop:546 length:486 start_codon:yes stop_codon:yes gene_type:complete
MAAQLSGGLTFGIEDGENPVVTPPSQLPLSDAPSGIQVGGMYYAVTDQTGDLQMERVTHPGENIPMGEKPPPEVTEIRLLDDVYSYEASPTSVFLAGTVLYRQNSDQFAHRATRLGEHCFTPGVHRGRWEAVCVDLSLKIVNMKKAGRFAAMRKKERRGMT